MIVHDFFTVYFPTTGTSSVSEFWTTSIEQWLATPQGKWVQHHAVDLKLDTDSTGIYSPGVFKITLQGNLAPELSMEYVMKYRL